MTSLGLRIKGFNGNEDFDVWGVVSWKTFNGIEGKIYYCGGSSYPEACVLEVYTVQETAEEIYQKLAVK